MEQQPSVQSGASGPSAMDPATECGHSPGTVAAPAYDEDLLHKVMLLGDSGVGKTCFLVQFKDGAFLAGSFIATVGIDFRIWDTAGQERFRSVTHAYYRDAQALLLLYDITSKTSFDNIRAWLTEIHEYAQQDVVIMLLGNKSDMCSERVIKQEEGERLAKEYGVPFMETSAKTGVNVELAFLAIAKELKQRAVQQPNEPKFQIHDFIESQKKKSSCCGFM
ncbi:RAB37 protein, partial [Polypterus senegalus]